MKKILLFVLLCVCGFAYGQTPAGYTKINARYKWTAGIMDSGFHVPQYNGVPSGTRTGVWAGDGAIAVDTTNHYFYIFSGGAWLKIAKFSDITTPTWQQTLNAGRTGDSAYIDNAATGESYAIRNRNISIGFPIVTFKPVTANKNIAFDIMPRGTPGDYSDNGIAWMDIVDTDISGGSLPVNAARVGITSTAIQFGSRNFGGATLKPVQFVVGTDTRMTLSTSNTATFNIGKITQSQSVASDYVGYTLLNTNDATAGADPIFFIGTDIGTNKFGYLRYSNGATTVTTIRKANMLEVVANLGASEGMLIGSFASTGKIKFYTNNSGAGGERMRIDSVGNVGIGTSAPAKIFHTVGTVRHETLGTASSDPARVFATFDSNGDLLPSVKTLNDITFQIDTITLASFGAGARIVSDTTAFTDSTLYGAFYNDGSDTLVVSKIWAIMAGGTSDTLGVQLYYNDSINVIGSAIATSTLPVNSTTTGNSTTTLSNQKIPPGNWVWCKSPTVVAGRKPYYLSVSISGYKKRVN